MGLSLSIPLFSRLDSDSASESSSEEEFRGSFKGFEFFPLDGWMTRRIFPVVGSRSTRASVGAISLGMAFEMESLSFLLLLASPFVDVDVDTEVCVGCSFSIPPVAVLRREVRPRRR